MEILGIQFAPLKIPLERRLQTLSAAIWICILAFGGPICLLVTFYLLIFTEYIKYLVIAYLIWAYFDRNTCFTGGRRKRWTHWMRNNILWKYFVDYFPIKLVKTVDLDPSKNYLLCCYPHGVLSTGIFGAFATDILQVFKVFPGLEVRTLTLTQHFMIPFFREFAYSLGTCSSSRESIEYLLQDHSKTKELNKLAVLVVGGASEALNCKPSVYKIILNQRKGFVKISLKTGTSLVPVLSFGETDLYDQIKGEEGSLLEKCQYIFRKITGISPVILLGRGFFQYSFGIVPNRKPVTVVVGSPIEIPQIIEPTDKEINKYHSLFKDKLIELFEAHKHKYLINADNIHLIIE